MSTGFPFGAKTTATPTFGTGSITFGTPATQNPPSFGFGAPSTQPTTGYQFGAATTSAGSSALFGTPSGGLNFKPGGFGTTPTTQPTGLFGTTPSNVSSAGLSFPAATSANAMLGFGTPTAATSAPLGGLTFGTPASTSALQTGAFAAPAAPAPSGFTFTTPASSAPGLSFGNTATSAPASGGLFGTTTTIPGATGSFGFGTATSATPSLVLGMATTSTGGLSFGLGTTTTTTSTMFGLGGTSTTTTASPLNLTTSAAPVVGLGGIASTQCKPGTTVTTQKEVPPKEQPLPNEILQTVEHFKEFVKQQKMHSSDIARCSVRDFRKVEQEIDVYNNNLNDVESQLHKNRHLAEKLKYDTARCLQNVEMAQRTHDTPPGLQYENTAPLRYFLELGNQFEREMQTLKIQIESAEKYVKNYRSSDVLTPQDLALGMRRLHETFVALAGRLQSVHSQVESQKETYLNMCRQISNDTSNPFDKLNKPTDLTVNNLRNTLIYSPPKVATGPTPFNNLALGNGSYFLQQQQQNPQPSPFTAVTTSASLPGFGNTLSFGTQLGTQASNTSLFGSSSFGQTSFGTTSNFQLQKPPTGNKRGKQI